MVQRYYDCRTPADQIRYTETTEQLQIHVNENFKSFGHQGHQNKAVISDPTQRPSIKPVTMPQKVDTTDPIGNKMMDKTEAELRFLEKFELQEDVKTSRKEQKELESEMRKNLTIFCSPDVSLPFRTGSNLTNVKSHTSYEKINNVCES
jgi:hypothetical protein